MVADLEAQLKESESKLEEFELRAAREREGGKELEEKLIMNNKEDCRSKLQDDESS